MAIITTVNEFAAELVLSERSHWPSHARGSTAQRAGSQVSIGSSRTMRPKGTHSLVEGRQRFPHPKVVERELELTTTVWTLDLCSSAERNDRVGVQVRKIATDEDFDGSVLMDRKQVGCVYARRSRRSLRGAIAVLEP